MEAIEFQTTLGSDGIISIPTEISAKVKRGKVRVIVIEEDPAISTNDGSNEDRERIRNYINYLMDNPFKVDRSVPFLTRDEIYERIG